MCAFFCLILNIFFIIICYARYKSVLAPPVVLNIMWGYSNLINFIVGWNSAEFVYLILCIPPFMFTIGFMLANCGVRIENKIDFLNSKFLFDERALNIIFKLNLVISAAYFIFIISRIGVYYRDSLWYTLRLIKWGESKASSPIFVYPVPMIFVMPSLFWFQYKFTGTHKTRVIVSIVIALTWGFFYSSRTPIFTFIIITIFSQLLCSMKQLTFVEKRKRKKIIIISTSFILFMFIYIAVKKYGNAYGDVGILSFTIKSLVNYTNLSSVCFVEWYKKGFDIEKGRITFRFVYAVLSRIGLNIDVPNTSSGGLFLYYNGYQTNAFTVARNYVQDFGVIFMAFMLFLFGFVHGFFYKKAMSEYGQRKLKYILMTAVLYVPLFYQIMTDQYMNCFSQWLQYYLWITLFTSSLFLRKRCYE